MARRPLSKTTIHATEKNDSPSADQGLSTAKPTESSTPTDIIFIFPVPIHLFYHSSVALFWKGSLFPLFYSVYM